MKRSRRKLRVLGEIYSNDPIKDQSDVDTYIWGQRKGLIGVNEPVADELLDELRHWRQLERANAKP
jgi:hypothetical protein